MEILWSYSWPFPQELHMAVLWGQYKMMKTESRLSAYSQLPSLCIIALFWATSYLFVCHLSSSWLGKINIFSFHFSGLRFSNTENTKKCHWKNCLSTFFDCIHSKVTCLSGQPAKNSITEETNSYFKFYNLVYIPHCWEVFAYSLPASISRKGAIWHFQYA